ncbi:MAG: polysaccharide deacetylase family protein [Halalkalicoccus sp.]
MDEKQNRRRFLAAMGAGTFALAGCTDAVGDLTGGNGEGDDGNGNGGGEEDDGQPEGNGDESQATPPAIDQGEVVSDFDEDLEEWFATSGELSADEENALTGSRTARIDGEGAAAGIGRAFPDGLDMEGQHLSLALRVDNPRPARVTVRIFAPGQADQLWSTRTVLTPYEGWLRMDVGYTGQRGEPFLDDVQEIQITLDDPNAEDGDAEEDEAADAAEEEAGGEDDEEDDANGENGITFFVDDFRMTPQASQGYVMLTFDDNVASQYENAFPMFEERDMRGVLNVIPPSLNRPERLSIDQLREMRDAGWDVSAHAERSDGLAEMDPEEAREALESDHEYLVNRGFPDGARFHTVPYHSANQEVIDIARDYYEMNSYFGGTPNAVPMTDPMHLSRVDMHDIGGFTSMIDMAAEHNQLAIGLAHGVVPEDEIGEDPLADMTTEQLEELLDYIEESDVQLVTASDLLDTDPSEL